MQSKQSSSFQPPRFDAFEVALELIAALAPVIDKVAKRDRDLARQLRKASSSIALNVSEGNRRLGRDRIHLWSVASGSCKETQTILRVALAWAYVDQDDVAKAMELVDRELAMLWRLTH